MKNWKIELMKKFKIIEVKMFCITLFLNQFHRQTNAVS